MPASHSHRLAFAGEEFSTVNAIDDGPANIGTANGTKNGSAPSAPDSVIGPPSPRYSIEAPIKKRSTPPVSPSDS